MKESSSHLGVICCAIMSSSTDLLYDDDDPDPTALRSPRSPSASATVVSPFSLRSLGQSLSNQLTIATQSIKQRIGTRAVKPLPADVAAMAARIKETFSDMSAVESDMRAVRDANSRALTLSEKVANNIRAITDGASAATAPANLQSFYGGGAALLPSYYAYHRRLLALHLTCVDLIGDYIREVRHFIHGDLARAQHAVAHLFASQLLADAAAEALDTHQAAAAAAAAAAGTATATATTDSSEKARSERHAAEERADEADRTLTEAVAAVREWSSVIESKRNDLLYQLERLRSMTRITQMKALKLIRQQIHGVPLTNEHIRVAVPPPQPNSPKTNE